MNIDSLMIDEISELYKSVGWTNYTKDTARLRRMIVNDGLKATIKKISRLEGKLLNEVVAAYESQI